MQQRAPGTFDGAFFQITAPVTVDSTGSTASAYSSQQRDSGLERHTASPIPDRAWSVCVPVHAEGIPRHVSVPGPADATS